MDELREFLLRMGYDPSKIPHNETIEKLYNSPQTFCIIKELITKCRPRDEVKKAKNNIYVHRLKHQDTQIDTPDFKRILAKCTKRKELQQKLANIEKSIRDNETILKQLQQKIFCSDKIELSKLQAELLKYQQLSLLFRLKKSQLMEERNRFENVAYKIENFAAFNESPVDLMLELESCVSKRLNALKHNSTQFSSNQTTSSTFNSIASMFDQSYSPEQFQDDLKALTEMCGYEKVVFSANLKLQNIATSVEQIVAENFKVEDNYINENLLKAKLHAEYIKNKLELLINQANSNKYKEQIAFLVENIKNQIAASGDKASSYEQFFEIECQNFQLDEILKKIESYISAFLSQSQCNPVPKIKFDLAELDNVTAQIKENVSEKLVKLKTCEPKLLSAQGDLLEVVGKTVSFVTNHKFSLDSSIFSKELSELILFSPRENRKISTKNREFRNEDIISDTTGEMNLNNEKIFFLFPCPHQYFETNLAHFYKKQLWIDALKAQEIFVQRLFAEHPIEALTWNDEAEKVFKEEHIAKLKMITHDCKILWKPIKKVESLIEFWIGDSVGSQIQLKGTYKGKTLDEYRKEYARLMAKRSKQ